MMLSTLLRSSALALAATLAAHGAQAATLFTLGAPTGEIASPGSVSTPFTAAAGAGSAAFRLDGYRSLDGATYWTDVFTLSLNGQAVLSGTWDLGGGSPGANQVFLAPDDTSIAAVSNSYFQGGYVDFVVPLTLAEGANTLTFSYASPGWGGPDGIADEAWGLHSLTVSGIAVPPPSGGLPGMAVPEPMGWTLMILGFGGIGAVLRRARRAQPAIA